MKGYRIDWKVYQRGITIESQLFRYLDEAGKSVSKGNHD
ncbi:Uncharacterised protein [Mycobacteroides abscessus subsp. abscessus]|nr:Uncharacterised protein [Mycobacteroides abscessus subsp. abscessus]